MKAILRPTAQPHSNTERSCISIDLTPVQTVTPMGRIHQLNGAQPGMYDASPLNEGHLTRKCTILPLEGPDSLQ